MEYKEFLAVLLVLGILGVEPAGAVEIGSLNQVNSPDTSNLCYDSQYMAKKSVIYNQNHNNGLNKLKMHNLYNGPKKTFKLIVKEIKAHNYHKLLKNSLFKHYNKDKKLQNSHSHKVSTKGSTRSAETSVISDSNVNDNETNMDSAAGVTGNETVLSNVTGKKKLVENETSIAVTALTDERIVGNETNINETALSNVTDERIVGNETNINETALSNVTDERIVGNETNINETALSNVTGVNETSLNQTDNSTQDSPTKTHTLNTIENAGYALAAIAGCFAVGIAVAPEGITKTICVVGAVVCGIAAAACFVAHAIASWFDW